MITSDFVVLISILLIAVAVLSSLLKNGKGKFGIIPGKLIALSFAVLFMGFTLEDTRLAKALVSGIIIGSLLQPLLADPYLTKRTLYYKKEGWFFISTPWWMMLLWGIAVTHLVYFYLRLIGLLGMPLTVLEYWILAFSGLLYFFIFELITNNLTFWWWRKHYYLGILNIAFYALAAEFVTACGLIYFSIKLIENSLDWEFLIGLSIPMGIAIAIFFVIACKGFYKKQPSI